MTPPIATASGAAADHDEKMNYDDINEFFWTTTPLALWDQPDKLPAAQRPAAGQPLLSPPAVVPLGQKMVGWLKDSPKTYYERRGLMAPLKSHARVLTLYLVFFYALVLIAIDAPFEQSKMPEDLGGNSRQEYLHRHPAMFKCGECSVAYASNVDCPLT